MWNYGPNLTVDLILETTGPDGQRRTLMGNRDGRLQFPGTFVNAYADPPESQAQALLRTLKEKLQLEQKDPELPGRGMKLMDWLERALQPEKLELLIEADVNELDPRNTDDAYVVTQVYRLNIPYDVMEAIMGAMEPSGPWKDAYLVPFEARVAAMSFADHGTYLTAGALTRPTEPVNV